jgi:serine/threonine protein kinase
MLSPTSSVQPGSSIGGYSLVHPIGRGGMAEVWLARRPGGRASRHVAVKLIADRFVGDDAYRRMFRSEAELSALLTHANIVQVFHEGEEHGRSYLVMEWVDGVDLAAIRTGLTPVEPGLRSRVTAYIIGQLLHALGYAHNVTAADGNPLCIVHRDVSPQNVLVSNQGEVKLTDFGVAHHVLEESSGVHVKGKLRYMAPEQLAGKTRAPTVDLYAVGAILHELLDGKLFRAHVHEQPEMLGEVMRGQIPPLSREVPAELDALRVGLLQPDP